MDWNKLLPIIIPSVIALISGLFGYFLKYYLDKKARFSSDNAAIKREMYEDYIGFMMKFVSNPENQAGDFNDEQTKDILSKMREFHRKAILYSSPRVVNAFADFLQYSYKHPDGDGKGEYTMVLVTNVFKEMRRDIGLSNYGLRGGAIRLIRPIINDYDQVIAPAEYGLISKAKKAAGMTAKDT
jgi:hypothetical protein